MTDEALKMVCRHTLEDEDNRFLVALHRHGKDRSSHLADKVLLEVPKSESSTGLRERAVLMLNDLLTIEY